MGAKLIFRASFVYQWRPGSKTLDGELVETQRLCGESGATKKKAGFAGLRKKRLHQENDEDVKRKIFGSLHSLSLRTQQLAVHPPSFPSNTPLISFGPTSSSSSPAFMLDLQQLLSSGRSAHQWVGGGGGVDGVLGPPQAHMCSQHLRNALFSSPSVITSVNKTARCFPLPLALLAPPSSVACL